jgi:hypothetical protein
MNILQPSGVTNQPPSAENQAPPPRTGDENESGVLTVLVPRYLKDTFKKSQGGRPKKADHVFPVCLLMGATILSDRMIVINWWCNVTAEQQAEQKEQLFKSFKRPTVSASLRCLRVSANGAKEAAERFIAHCLQGLTISSLFSFCCNNSNSLSW